jgi:hypothetical protein
MPVSKKGIKKEHTQANDEREEQGILHPVKIAPTSPQWQYDLEIDD